MEFVRMDERHIAAVASLEKECFSMPWSENVLSGELNNQLALWVVAVDGDRLAGYVGSQVVMGEADMMNLAIDPAYRRQGVGQKLVENLIERLKEVHATMLTLEVRASNEAAIALYTKLGFVAVGRRPNYYVKPKEDALILRKEWEV